MSEDPLAHFPRWLHCVHLAAPSLGPTRHATAPAGADRSRPREPSPAHCSGGWGGGVCHVQDAPVVRQGHQSYPRWHLVQGPLWDCCSGHTVVFLAEEFPQPVQTSGPGRAEALVSRGHPGSCPVEKRPGQGPALPLVPMLSGGEPAWTQPCPERTPRGSSRAVPSCLSPTCLLLTRPGGWGRVAPAPA